MKYDIRFITETTRFNRTTVKKEQMSNKTKATARKLVKQFTAKFPKYTRTNPQYECVWVPHLGCYLNTRSSVIYTYTHKVLWKTTVYTMVVIKTIDVPEPSKETPKAETTPEVETPEAETPKIETPEAATPAASTPETSYHIVVKEHTRDGNKVHHKTVYDKHVTNKLRNKLINGFIGKYKNEYKSIKKKGSITYTTNAKDKEAWVTLTSKEN